MSDPKYNFLSWLRQGLTKGITDTDGLNGAAGTTGENNPGKTTRQTINIDINVTKSLVSGGNQNVDVPKALKLAGPEDVIGVNPSVIINTTPDPYQKDFEPNYLASIEFYEEDFPWRYTPARAGKNGGNTNDDHSCLRPWLSLIVLKDGVGEEEFTVGGIGGADLPFITLNSSGLQALPSEDETWAWAHTQVNSTINLSPDLATGVNAIKDNDPNDIYSRIICPRKLEADKHYVAFLVPTFEVGRLAGLGEDVSGVSRLKSSWPAGGSTLDMPVYYQWEFNTGQGEDFESLARKIVPKYLPSSFGQVEIDVQFPNHSKLNATFPTETGSIVMQSAINHVYGVEEEYDIEDGNNEFTTKLIEILNDTEVRIEEYQSAVTGDPVITAPIYGRFASLKKKIDDVVTENWFNRINLDPRYRTAAGNGAEVVRQMQEELMEIAWSQVGEVQAANKRLNSLYIAVSSALSMYTQNIKNSADITTYLFSNPVHTRVKTGSDTIALATKSSGIPDNLVEQSFRKNSRIGTAVATGVNFNMNNLVSKLNSGQIVAVSQYSAPTGMSSMTFLSAANATCGSAQAAAPYTKFSATPPGTTYALGTSTATWNASGVNMVNGVCSNGNTQNALGGNAATSASPIDFAQVASDVQAKVDPVVSIQGRGLTQLKLTDANGQPVLLNQLGRIMAAPDITLPLYKKFEEINKDLFLPDLDLVPENSVSLLQSNQKFIEAFMVGANHEFARELLWREYPTDQRGTSLKMFWPNADPSSTDTDITSVHQWSFSSELGDHTGRSGTGDLLMLVVRGDLLKKYPNTVLYAHKAKWQGTNYNLARELDETQEPVMPSVYAQVKPDVFLVGFALDAADVIGDENDQNGTIPTPNPGYFFVFKEIFSELRFGLDVDETFDANLPGSLDDLTWGHMKILSGDPLTNITLSRLGTSGEAYGINAAKVAMALGQKPVKIAFHGSQLINTNT